jgi:hypothetical protein
LALDRQDELEEGGNSRVLKNGVHVKLPAELPRNSVTGKITEK